METAAHRAVHVDEIIRCILVRLRDMEYNRMSCVAVALTSSQLYNPAMDVCRSHVDRIRRFKSCFPEGSCMCDTFRQSEQASTDKVTPKYFPPHHEAQCQWSRAYNLSCRVRTIEIQGYQLGDLASVTVGPLLALGKPFFPNLKGIRWDITYNYSKTFLDLGSCLIQPTLSSCVLHLDEGTDNSELSRFVTRLATSAPGLEELRVRFQDSIVSPRARSHILSLPGLEPSSGGQAKIWPKLRVLGVPSSILEAEILRAQIIGSDLQELGLNTSDLSSFGELSQWQSCLPVLRVLSVRHITPPPAEENAEDHDKGESQFARVAEDLSSFLQCIASPHLEEVSLELDCVTGNALRSILEAVSKRAGLLKVKLSVTTAEHLDREYHFGRRDCFVRVVDFADFKPLYRLSSLRSLEVRGLPVKLCRWQIRSLGKAWPQLRSLKLVPTVSRIRKRTKLSIRDFPLFPKYCPNLSELAVLFDPSHCPRSLPKGLVRHHQKRTIVDASDTWVSSVEEARPVVAFLRGVFPGCDLRRPSLCGRGLQDVDEEDWNLPTLLEEEDAAALWNANSDGHLTDDYGSDTT